ncbi:MAG: hypothetical protein HY875_11300 [Chloroflexi bacterium]|nr:hypothetical protein [Chloroflexota bacterium]
MTGVTRFAWRPFAIPFREEFVAAHGTLRERAGVVMLVETASGLRGIGEASPLPSYGGGSVKEVLAACPAAGATLVGGTLPGDDEDWMPPSGLSAGSSAALRCGVETALASIAAEAAGQPLWRWFRGGEGPAEAVVAVNAVVDAGEPKAAAAEALAYVRRGFKTLKLKVGTGDDIERVLAVRRAVGPAIALRADANGAWPIDGAPGLLGRCRELGLEMVEQPVAPGPGAIARMAALARSVAPLLVGIDESCRSMADVGEMAADGAGLVAVIKPMVTGLAEARRMAGAAAAAGIPVVVTTMFDAGPGTAVAMHLAASLGGGSLAHGLATLEHLAGDIVSGVPAVESGSVRPGDRPGLGLALDEAALERFATGPWREARA